MIADQFLDTQLWDLLWTLISQSLKPESTSPTNEQQEDEMLSTLANPDWTLLSPNGYLSLLQLASRMLTMSPQNCSTLICKDENVMFDTLSYMLSDRFLINLKKAYDSNNGLNASESLSLARHSSLSNRKQEQSSDPAEAEANDNESNGEYLVNEFILTISQLLCFPFAIDASEEIITRTYKIIKEFNLFNKIISAIVSNLSTLTCDIPIGLIARLILTDDDLVQLLIEQLINSAQLCEFFSKLLYNSNSSETLITDIFSIFCHLSRKSEEVVMTIIKILKGPASDKNANFQILVRSLNGNLIVKSRCCNMIGNLMRYNDAFYDILKKNKQIFENLVRCCQIDELNVRKVGLVILI